MSEILERIQRRAYEFYCERGCANGYEREDWLRAEKEVKEDIAEAPVKQSEVVRVNYEEEREPRLKPAKAKREKVQTMY